MLANRAIGKARFIFRLNSTGVPTPQSHQLVIAGTIASFFFRGNWSILKSQEYTFFIKLTPVGSRCFKLRRHKPWRCMQTRARISNQRRRIRPPRRSPSIKKAPTPEDLREHRRYAVAETSLRVIWVDADGNPKIESNARPVNVSELGIAIELPEPALLFSNVRLESAEGELLGFGEVRHCGRMGAKYIVGVQFADSLTWRAPEGPIIEPIPLTAPPELIPEDLSGGTTLDSGPTVAGPEGTETPTPDGHEQAITSQATAGASPPALEPHLLLEANTDEGLLKLLPVAVRAGGVILLALLLGSFFLRYGSTTPTSSVRGAATSALGGQGWVTEWASDSAGSRRARQITLYRPSVQLSDYQMRFTGQIENKALGWVFRAADTNNYYGMKIEQQGGSVLYKRFAVVNGLESSATEKRLAIQARVDTAYSVRLEANGPHFSVYIQGEPIELWTDSRLKTGALGFMSEGDERARTSSVQFSF